MTSIQVPKGYKLWPEDKPVAVVLTFQVCEYIDPVTEADTGYAEVPQQTMWTAFEGEDAMRRAKSFMDSEQERDFTAADGWQWTVWGNRLAYEEYADWRTEQLLGPPSQEESST